MDLSLDMFIDKGKPRWCAVGGMRDKWWRDEGKGWVENRDHWLMEEFGGWSVSASGEGVSRVIPSWVGEQSLY